MTKSDDFEDKEIHFKLGEDMGKMRSCLYQKFHASGECLTSREHKKRTVLAMGTSLSGFESTTSFSKRTEA